MYLTIGTGGVKLYKFSGKVPYIAAQYEGFGFLDLILTNNGRNLTGTFFATNDKSIEDSFTLIK